MTAVAAATAGTEMSTAQAQAPAAPETVTHLEDRPLASGVTLTVDCM